METVETMEPCESIRAHDFMIESVKVLPYLETGVRSRALLFLACKYCRLKQEVTVAVVD
jgi:hypothetical protein